MYQKFYKLRVDPFRLSPDHAFCFRYPSFAKAKAYMHYALHAAEGFVMVTGKPGMGKTTLINDLVSGFNRSNYLVATLVNTQLESNDLLRMLAYEFGLNVLNLDKATVLLKLRQIFIHALQTKRRPLLIVDEAQNLTFEALEELRLLTNLQVNGIPLLQIFLVGQEELRNKLRDPSLEQFRQRITAACHLDYLNLEQTAAYVLHRLRVTGWNGDPKITGKVFPVIHQTCQGIPRRINQFCSRLLLHGSIEQKHELDVADAEIVTNELNEERLSPTGSEDFNLPDHSDLSATQANPNCADGDSLLRSAESLLQQQKKKTKRPVPAKRAAPPIPRSSQPPSCSPTPERTPESVSTNLPSNPAAPPAIEERPKSGYKNPNYDLRGCSASVSKWPVIAYTSLVLLFLVIMSLTIPKATMQEWIPDLVSAAKTHLSPQNLSPQNLSPRNLFPQDLPAATAADGTRSMPKKTPKQ